MAKLNILTKEVINGKQIDKDEALFLYEQPLKSLCEKADNIRKHFCQNRFDICTIINGKNGGCSENCRFCAQSAHNRTNIANYQLISPEEIISQAEINEKKGVLRYSIVTSGKKLPESEVDKICEIVKQIREKTNISVCVSFGLLDESQFRKLKEAGVSRAHNNLETSRGNFPNICTTHTFDDKIKAIKAALNAGLSVCSGGIMGLGETEEDRIDMAFTLRELQVKSVPINILNPIAGTPFEHNKKLTQEDILRIIAVYRFILPDSFIRLAGGRGLLEDKGKSCFVSGANAAITGDMLTTAGITTETDMKIIKDLGYEIKL